MSYHAFHERYTKDPSQEDETLQGVRETQEQFHGQRYWERPVETLESMPAAFISHDRKCLLRNDGARCTCSQESRR